MLSTFLRLSFRHDLRSSREDGQKGEPTTKANNNNKKRDYD